LPTLKTGLVRGSPEMPAVRNSNEKLRIGGSAKWAGKVT